MQLAQNSPLEEFDHKQDFLSIANHRLRVSRAGSGSDLLMLNGLGAKLEVLTPLRRQLRGYHTIAFDPPGVGDSSELLFPMRLRGHAKVVARMLDELCIERVDLFGLSWGGALAQEFTFRYPERVGKLILCSTTPGPALVATPSVYKAFFDPRKRSSREYLDKVAPILYGGRARNEAQTLYDSGVLHKLTPKLSRSFAFQMAAAAGWTSLPYLWRIGNETLIITGDDDPLVRPYHSRLMYLNLRKSQLHVMKGEGHFLVVSSAEETAALIESFLAG